jgi:hypothetical protein
MQAESTILTKEPRSRTITVRRCLLMRGRFVVRGDAETLTVEAALKRFAPTKSQDARMNVLKARTGHYLGTVRVEEKGDRNFLFVNQGPNGDISWLLRKHPEFEAMVKDVYRVEDVEIPSTSLDLPPLGFKDQGA